MRIREGPMAAKPTRPVLQFRFRSAAPTLPPQHLPNSGMKAWLGKALFPHRHKTLRHSTATIRAWGLDSRAFCLPFWGGTARGAFWSQSGQSGVVQYVFYCGLLALHHSLGADTRVRLAHVFLKEASFPTAASFPTFQTLFVRAKIPTGQASCQRSNYQYPPILSLSDSTLLHLQHLRLFTQRARGSKNQRIAIRAQNPHRPLNPTTTSTGRQSKEKSLRSRDALTPHSFMKSGSPHLDRGPRS